MVAFYIFGLRGAAVVRRERMWRPLLTNDTTADVSNPEEQSRSVARIAWAFAALGILTALAGWTVGNAGVDLVREFGWQESAVGGLLTAVASSLPELVTTLAAVRHGAYTLAISGIVGGNAFDTLFLAVSDAVYTDGSIYHAMSDKQQFLIGVTIAMTAVLLAGLVRRERSGPANVGTEGVLLMVGYLLVVAVMFS